MTIQEKFPIAATANASPDQLLSPRISRCSMSAPEASGSTGKISSCRVSWRLSRTPSDRRRYSDQRVSLTPGILCYLHERVSVDDEVRKLGRAVAVADLDLDPVAGRR